MRLARESLRQLVSHVHANRTDTIEGVTYLELARRIGKLDGHGRPYARGMGRILGKMGHLLIDLEGEWGEPIPHIQSLVVLKSGPLKGLPDEGISEFWPQYPTMSKPEKRNRMNAEHRKVAEFGSRWEQVLYALDLPRLTEPVTSDARGRRPRGTGGESEQHKALKTYVMNHPEIMGPDEGSLALAEYALPSWDQIDVLFRGNSGCVAVEVKSRVSDRYPDDYERGIYQTIKYRALLQAMVRDTRYEIVPNVRSVLVLESELPRQHRPLIEALGVEVVENVAMEGL